MFDKELVLAILTQINEALEKIANRTIKIKSADDFTDSPEGMEKLDGICMLFMAIGESLKNVDKITSGLLLSRFPEIDWKGTIGFRDIIAHHYFDIDAEQVFWICTNHVGALSATIKKIIAELK
ncbi:MAG TPA: antitoxin [Geobacter sp.]|nr:antitoxin [Geobacter sp.]